MNTYLVTYSGLSSNFKGFKKEVRAKNERDAVETVYSQILDHNYFEKDGVVTDSDGDLVADTDDTYFIYDGGCFSTEKV